MDESIAIAIILTVCGGYWLGNPIFNRKPTATINNMSSRLGTCFDGLHVVTHDEVSVAGQS